MLKETYINHWEVIPLKKQLCWSTKFFFKECVKKYKWIHLIMQISIKGSDLNLCPCFAW